MFPVIVPVVTPVWFIVDAIIFTVLIVTHDVELLKLTVPPCTFQFVSVLPAVNAVKFTFDPFNDVNELKPTFALVVFN